MTRSKHRSCLACCAVSAQRRSNSQRRRRCSHTHKSGSPNWCNCCCNTGGWRWTHPTARSCGYGCPGWNRALSLAHWARCR
ncbi:50S ribosomal protein L32 [Xanthomonas oryzae]|uniref:50S ribosomal protein L32 n=1 Tax=Xanthomonas oryzae TaxID=347 RepID=UPI003CCFCDFC